MMEYIMKGFWVGLTLAIVTGGTGWGILIAYNQFNKIIGG